MGIFSTTQVRGTTYGSWALRRYYVPFCKKLSLQALHTTEYYDIEYHPGAEDYFLETGQVPRLSGSVVCGASSWSHPPQSH